MALGSLGIVVPILASAGIYGAAADYLFGDDDDVVDVASPNLPPDPVYTQPSQPATSKPSGGGGGGYVAPTPAAPPPPPVESSGLSGIQMAAIGLGVLAVGAVVWKVKTKGGFSRNSHDEDED